MIKHGPKIKHGAKARQPDQKRLTLDDAKALVKEHLDLTDDKIHQEALSLVHHYQKRSPDLCEVIDYLRQKSTKINATKLQEENSAQELTNLPIAQNQENQAKEEIQEKETSAESIVQEYNMFDAQNHLKSLWQDKNAEILDKAAAYLVARKAIFKTLDSPFAQSFIKNNLLQIVQTKNIPIVQESILQQENTPPKQIFLPNFEQVNNGTKNIKKFQEMSSLSTTKLTSRYNQFVMLLGIPDLPRRHSGIDDSCHSSLPISFETQDLLQRGSHTLQFIHHKQNAIRPCPKVLFLRKPVKREEDPLTKKIHEGHTLDFYASHIFNENQAPIEFHIVGHGTKVSIGSYEKRFSPEDFAELFDEIATASQLKEALLKKTLVFVFHTCNSAYIDGGSSIEEIKEKLLKESVMGRFFQAMRDLKYNLTVKAYRGFYSTVNSGAGARVSSKVDDNNATTYSANSAEFEISQKGENPIIKLPDGNGLNFTVYFEPQGLMLGIRPQARN